MCLGVVVKNDSGGSVLGCASCVGVEFCVEVYFYGCCIREGCSSAKSRRKGIPVVYPTLVGCRPRSSTRGGGVL